MTHRTRLPHPKLRQAAYHPDRIAAILVTADYYGVKLAAQEWRVATGSVFQWRRRMEVDNDLLMRYHQKKDEFEARWHLELVKAQCAAIDYIRRAAAQEVYTAEYVHAIAGALKIAGEVNITREHFNADRYDLPDRLQSEEDPEAVAAPAV